MAQVAFRLRLDSKQYGLYMPIRAYLRVLRVELVFKKLSAHVQPAQTLASRSILN